MVSKVEGEIAVSSEEEQSSRDFWPLVNKDPAFYLPPMISRAQNFEDVILRRALQDITEGFYVDIGAWHPVDDSVTACFYETGWHGINVEPNPNYFAALERARPRDTNLACVVGAKSGTCLFTLIEGTGLSSGIPASIDPSRHPGTNEQKVVTMPCITLDELLALAGDKVVDFLKIDVEGMEAELVCGSEFTAHRPRIIVVEATRPLTQIPSHGDWEKHLLAKGYDFVLFDGLNRFYLRQDEAWRKPLFAIPPCVWDNFRSPTLAANTEERTAELSGRLLEANHLVESLNAQLIQAQESYSRALEDIAQAKERAAAELTAMTSDRDRLIDERDTLDVYSKMLQRSRDTAAAERQKLTKDLAAVTAELATAKLAVKQLAESRKTINELMAVKAERDRLAAERPTLVAELYRVVREEVLERNRSRWKFF